MSGALPASLVPIMVIILERASLKLLTASEMMAMELAIKPTKALKPTKTRLEIILMRLVFMTMDSRLFDLAIIVVY